MLLGTIFCICLSMYVRINVSVFSISPESNDGNRLNERSQ